MTSSYKSRTAILCCPAKRQVVAPDSDEEGSDGSELLLEELLDGSLEESDGCELDSIPLLSLLSGKELDGSTWLELLGTLLEGSLELGGVV